MTTIKTAFSTQKLVEAGGTLVAERRQEARYPTNDPADVQILPWNGTRVFVPATVTNISKSGLRLEMESLLVKGMRIEIIIRPRKLVVFGEVRYCRRSGSHFHAGVLIDTLVFPKLGEGQHLHDDQFVLYAAGEGLTGPEVLRINDHLAKCEDCVSKLVAAKKDMRSSLRSASPVIRWHPRDS